MAEYREVIIDWKYHRSWFVETLEENNDPFKNLFSSEGGYFDKSGILYQIYCDSHLYGQEKLAYIGKTDVSFRNRFHQHLKSYFAFANNISFRIGILEEKDKKDIEAWESILIANHKPFFNKTHLHSVKNKELINENDIAISQKILIINNGNHGSLKNSCTNFWWVDSN